MKDRIVQTGSPVLRQVAKPVPKKDVGSLKLKALIKKMKAALSQEEFGVALAAPQVGVPLRLFVVSGRVWKSDTEDAELPPDKVFINPELTKLSKKKREMSEGCLSVRGTYGTVLRHEKASIKALDEAGKPFIYNGAGLVAHIFQHECDHLEGILYTDKAKKLQDDKTYE